MPPKKRSRSASPSKQTTTAAGTTPRRNATPIAALPASVSKSPAAAVAAAARMSSPKLKSSSPPKATPKKDRQSGAAPKQVGKVDPDLPMTPEGVIYHLACKKENLADKIMLVGDPGRVPVVAANFDKGSITFRGSHREIVIITGTYKGTPVSCLSTGMGTDNVEIVVNEIHALKEYTVATNHWQTDKERQPQRVHLIRVGTCGSPRDDVSVGTLAISNHAIGMDNTSRYYVAPQVNGTASVKALSEAVNKTGLGKVGVYATKAHPDVVGAISAATEAFSKAKGHNKQPYIVGTTASGSGFYGCQGRAVGQFRGKLTVPNLVDDLGSIAFPIDKKGSVERVVNIEMENSALCYLSNCLGYKAGTVCAIIARRAGNMREFATPEVAKQTIANAIVIGLDALVSIK